VGVNLAISEVFERSALGGRLKKTVEKTIARALKSTSDEP
jgi:hypothetical protein